MSPLVLLSALLFFLTHGLSPYVTAIQQSENWGEPDTIVNDGAFAWLPQAVADSVGDVHVVWSRSTLDPTNDLGVDTIMYAKLSNGQWSVPVDILASNVPSLKAVRLRIDQNNVLHLLTVGPSELLYSTAHVNEADTATGWFTRELGESVQVADFALSTDGISQLVYALDRQGVFNVSLDVSTETWSSPKSVWLAPNADYSSGSVRIERSDDGILHVAWGMTAASERWNPIGVAYARSDDDGQSWIQTFELVEGGNQPSIGFDQDGLVHLVWNNPAGSSLGRGHAVSADGGVTWPQFERILSGYSGQTWWPALSQDNDGTLHLITAANSPREGYPRLFHLRWLGDRWSAPELVSGSLTEGEGPSLTVVNGNLLRVTWFSFGGTAKYGIYTNSFTTDASAIEPVAIVPPNRSEDLLEARQVPENEPVLPTLEADGRPASSNISTADLAKPADSLVWPPLLAGIVPVTLLLMLLLFRLRAVRN